MSDVIVENSVEATDAVKTSAEDNANVTETEKKTTENTDGGKTSVNDNANVTETQKETTKKEKAEITDGVKEETPSEIQEPQESSRRPAKEVTSTAIKSDSPVQEKSELQEASRRSATEVAAIRPKSPDRRGSLKEGKQHSYSQLHGTSTSLRRHSTSRVLNPAVTQARGSLKAPPEGIEMLKIEFDTINSKGDKPKSETTSQSETSNMKLSDVNRATSDVIIVTQPASINTTQLADPAPGTTTTTPGLADKKPKPKLQRRKSLNPRVMTPPGLEILDNKAMVAIRQQMEMDIKGGCGVGNSYKIWDIGDEQIFFATEDSSCLCRWMCGPSRQFSLEVFSTQDDQVLTFHRTCCRCDCCCCLDCFMCLQKLYVVDCLGRTIGAVKQKFSVLNAKLDIVDHDNNTLFKILGPCCPCRCSTEVYFQIFNKTGERQIGKIQKKWGGERTDNVNVDHEYFDVTFPARLDSVDKALILGAAFLVNCMYMEMS